MPYVWYALGASILALVVAVIHISSIMRVKVADKTMNDISLAIRQGAEAYLSRQTKTIGVFTILIFLVLGFVFNWLMAAGFLAGAILSLAAAYIGMGVCSRTNVRTAFLAKEGMQPALSIAFRGGLVTGLGVVGLALLGVSGFYLILRAYGLPVAQIPQMLIGFGFGASLVSLFARVGGGIFTKAADVGADLVGKIEQNIPEDDPRNPAVIADNVGDNVGDVAGMGADLFETYAVTLIAALVLASSVFTGGSFSQVAIEYPLMLGAVAIVASILGAFFVRLGSKKNIMGALYKGLAATSIFSIIGFYFVTNAMLGNEMRIFYASLVGIALTVLMNVITEYYTSTAYKPVQDTAKAAETGAGTNVIIGLAYGLRSTFLPIMAIVIAIMLAYWLGDTSSLHSGIYGIAIAAVAMLSTTGMVIAMDAYGPITDNAGGIAEMANLPEHVREVTDALDAVGNTTKAVTKGYAIGSAALAALVLFQAYNEEFVKLGKTLSQRIDDPTVLVGLFIGALLPALFSSYCMQAVGRAAHKVVDEVRRQFRDIKGIMEGKAKPDYKACVDIVTKAALYEMIMPGLLAVVAPIAVAFLLGPEALAGLLAGVMVSGLVTAIAMCTGGAAWDNAKKYIEKGHFGGKGSPTHKAAVVGDTVGDPYKDTAGPAINALIKVINTIALILAPILASMMV
ncbi:MAG: sodium-translocating pyrophosphatase [Candidatus Abawacabacteria bacterium]|nr:sodium-translocating pyrophosphatase [Candidatus Abawacabacteria bacterium]